MARIFASLTVVSLLIPSGTVFALGGVNGFPTYPMAFWGTVTINGSAAPTGTVVRAYYGTMFAGSATTTESGVYGYTAPTKQKLVIGAGTGAITFTVQAPGFNGGAETGGNVAVTYSGFTSELTVNDNLVFTILAPAPSTPSSGSSGGGGGGGFSNVSTPQAPAPAPTSTSTTSVLVTVQTPSISTSTPPIVSSIPIPAPQAKSDAIPQTPPATSAQLEHDLYFGSRGEAVLALQNMLIHAGILQGPATGYYGKLTAAAVKKFQKANGLPLSGTVGPKTRLALNGGGRTTSNSAITTSQSATSHNNSRLAQAAGVAAGGPLSHNMTAGNRGNDVKLLQQLLKTFGVYSGAISGYYGSLTKAAVSVFQKQNGLPQTGAVGSLTRQTLNQQHSQ